MNDSSSRSTRVGTHPNGVGYRLGIICTCAIGTHHVVRPNSLEVCTSAFMTTHDLTCKIKSTSNVIDIVAKWVMKQMIVRIAVRNDGGML